MPAMGASSKEHPLLRTLVVCGASLVGLGCELSALLTLVSDVWSKPATSSPYPPGHGALSASRTRAVTEQALRTVVLPGLARFGIEPR
jgi:hypothetical protein